MNREEYLDRTIFKVEDVSVFPIPPPRKEDGFKHNISYWNLDSKPLWKGNLEIHELEKTENVNPFQVKSVREIFSLEVILVDKNQNVFAQIPRVNSLNLQESNIIPTDSSKVYAIFPEVDNDLDLEIGSVKQGRSSHINDANSPIKRIALGLKFQSSFDASNFNLYLKQFDKDYKIYEESFLEDLQIQKEENNNAKEIKIINQDINDLNDQFYEINMNDDTYQTSQDREFANKIQEDEEEEEEEEEKDDDDDDFGDFTEIS